MNNSIVYRGTGLSLQDFLNDPGKPISEADAILVESFVSTSRSSATGWEWYGTADLENECFLELSLPNATNIITIAKYRYLKFWV